MTISPAPWLQNGYVMTNKLKETAQMKTINKEEPVARSRFIDCPNCKTHTLKLTRAVQAGRCKSCHESYKIVMVYVKEGKKPKPATKSEGVSAAPSPDTTLPSWQIPTDNSLFGSSTTETSPIFSDTSSIFGQDHKDGETSTGSEQ